MKTKQTEQINKPNFVTLNRFKAAIIHLDCSSPNNSSDLPENTSPQSADILSGQLNLCFPIWSCTARSLPSRDCYQTRRCALTAPFHPSPIQNPKSKIPNRIGWSVLCCTCRRLIYHQTPGRYPARRPTVFGLSSFIYKIKSDCLICSRLLGLNILTICFEKLQFVLQVLNCWILFLFISI